MHLKKEHCIAGFSFYILIVMVGLLYNHGVNDAFYFDDFSNLSALNDSGSVHDYNSFKEFVLGNAAGPTGRPVSMISFLIDDNTWPSTASEFKNTNILIHLLIGAVLFWAAFLISRIVGVSYPALAALFVCAVWLLNPFHASTVLYPVQRMAQLSTLFCVIGVLIYLKARVKLGDGKIISAFLYGIALFLSFLLAVFSKENGAVLPVLLTVLEVSVLKSLPWGKKCYKRLVCSVLLIGSFCVFSIIVYKASLNGWGDLYPGRDFTPYQRLITEPSVLLYYIKELLLPSLYTPGLYYDDVHPYLGLMVSSWVPMVSILVVLFIFGLAIFNLNRYSLLGFSILFFFAGHIIESTALNLELIFEHRNYLPSLFIGFFWLELARFLSKYSIPKVIVFLFPLILYPSILFARTDLWADRVVFGAYLAKTSPHSIRSHIELNNALLYDGQPQAAKKALEEAIRANPDNIYLRMHVVLVDCLLGVKDSGDMDNLISMAKTQAFDGRDRLAIEKMWQYMRNGRCDFITPGYFRELMMAFEVGQQGGQDQGEISRRLLRIYADRFYVMYPSYSPSKVKPLKAVLSSENPEYIMVTAAYLASVNRFDEALKLSDKALQLVRMGKLHNSLKDPVQFAQDILSFQETVEEDKENFE
ncbi:hypothetical protein EZI54_08720 [Marinobacter halodurans]|uniref:Tetratricopeptide repeat protein n=1 Tax=Marinobacter halodurans TaxID=2528979 RepID=A0ABY1ZNM1_9GAMM|nr:hypothetical protein [Marinobacter halodurans]TBW56716.1 hypothetical protein EZI54_08720 [Marinobacter halodurans]